MSRIRARQILDSRGRPTVEAWAEINGVCVSAAVPSGASKGKREALELRDGAREFKGLGVSKAIENIREIILPALSGIDSSEQRIIDDVMIELDGTKNKSVLGVNAILAVSLIAAKITAAERGDPLYVYLAKLAHVKRPTLLPVPLMNIVNGGAHARNGLDFQEFMIAPVGAHTFSDAVCMCSEIYMELGKSLDASGVGFEGGYSPQNFKHEGGTARVKEMLEFLIAAIERAGYRAGEDVMLALDVAANEFFKDGSYALSGGQNLTPKEFAQFYVELAHSFPIISIEDGTAEDDLEGWKELTRALGRKIQIVGDDLFVTNPMIFQSGIDQGIANAILVKLNQIGTLSETLDVIALANKHRYAAIISHRSGETNDTTISDLAVATRAGQIKTGAPARGERVAKYNRLLEIEEELGDRAEYPGRSSFTPLAT